MSIPQVNVNYCSCGKDNTESIKQSLGMEPSIEGVRGFLCPACGLVYLIEGDPRPATMGEARSLASNPDLARMQKFIRLTAASMTHWNLPPEVLSKLEVVEFPVERWANV